MVCPLGVLALCLLLSETPFYCRLFRQPASSAASFAPNIRPMGSNRAGDWQNQVLAKHQFQLIYFLSLWARLPAPFIFSSFQPTGNRFLPPASLAAWPHLHPSLALGEVQGFSPVPCGCFLVHSNFFCPAFVLCRPRGASLSPAPCQYRQVIFKGCQQSGGPVCWRGPIWEGCLAG